MKMAEVRNGVHKEGYDAFTYASYADAQDPKFGEPIEVPLKIASEQNLKDYGRLVKDFDKEEVWLETWPAQGWRPVCPGTGCNAGVTEGAFVYKWEGDQCSTSNHAVGFMGFISGRLPAGVPQANRTHVLVREANYHPDGGQCFYPRDGAPFVALLALPTEDVKPEHFVAFYFDGSVGVQIKPNIWHQPMYPINDEQVFRNKQGANFACILVDTVKEFGKYMKVPLKPEFAQKA